MKSYVEFRPAYDLKPVKLEDVASCYKEDFICVTKCLGCARPVLWIENEIVWPTPKGILPVEEMPQDAKEIFKEAQSIINLSCIDMIQIRLLQAGVLRPNPAVQT